jgi:hypothetical protein
MLIWIHKVIFCYILAMVRTQVRYLESVLIRRDNYEPRTKLVSFLKGCGNTQVRKKKKKDLHVVDHRLIKPVQVLYIRLSIIVK